MLAAKIEILQPALKIVEEESGDLAYTMEPFDKKLEELNNNLQILGGKFKEITRAQDRILSQHFLTVSYRDDLGTQTIELCLFSLAVI